MGSCQGPAREREPVPSARRLKHNLAIILVSTFHMRRRGRREKPAETYNKDSSRSGIHLPEQILLFLPGQWHEGLKVSRRGLYRWSGVRWGCVGVWFDPPPLTPIVLREHKGSCQTPSGQLFGQTQQAAAAEGLNLAEAATNDQSGDKEKANGLSSQMAFSKM